ncbi:hypothetical protein NBRC116188_25810 [Oceaniserpentilla sp. 4NH20-0058]|uniref:hypothetical protein n=1 Tax=Oceaniserpentilla sp. 4NH20-0058 TaxID=3127660 RepID=UPI003104A9F0
MKSFLSRIVTPLLVSPLLILSAAVQAEYETVFLDLAASSEMSHFRLGLGDTSRGIDGDKVTSMFYLGYYQSDDVTKFENQNLGNQKTEIITLGVGGFGYLENHEEEGGAEFDFELSKSTSEALDYDRTAFGMRAQIFLPMAAGLQANIGVNLRPFFLSQDWDETANLEYEYQAGIEYAFNWDMAIYAHYRYLGAYLKNDDKINMAEGTLFGLRARF